MYVAETSLALEHYEGISTGKRVCDQTVEQMTKIPEKNAYQGLVSDCI